MSFEFRPRPASVLVGLLAAGLMLTGVGGFLLAKLLGSVRKKMLTAGLPAVLDDLDETGTLRATSTLRAKP